MESENYVISRACRFFVTSDDHGFDIGYMHGLAYCLNYDSSYKTVQMLIDYLQKRISMEGA